MGKGKKTGKRTTGSCHLKNSHKYMRRPVRAPERRKMFINEKILIRLMKKAQKGTGVYIGRWNGWYVISGSYWIARIAAGCLPRPIAAAMVELSGSIPEEGEAWTADKEKNQLEAFDMWNTPELLGRMYVRPVWLATPGGTPMKVLQKEDGGIFTYPDPLVMAAFGTIDRANQETEIVGPTWAGDGKAVWTTNQAAWLIRSTYYAELSEIMQLLAETPLEYTEVQ